MVTSLRLKIWLYCWRREVKLGSSHSSNVRNFLFSSNEVSFADCNSLSRTSCFFLFSTTLSFSFTTDVAAHVKPLHTSKMFQFFSQVFLRPERVVDQNDGLPSYIQTCGENFIPGTPYRTVVASGHWFLGTFRCFYLAS